MRKSNLILFFIYYFYLLFLEIVFRIVGIGSVSFNIIYTFIYLVPVSFILVFLNRIFYEYGSVVNKIILFLVSIYFSLEIVFKKIFNVYFSIRSAGLAGNVGSFIGETFKYIFNNFLYIVLMFIPFILVCVFGKYIKFNRISKKSFFVFLILIYNGFTIYGISTNYNSDIKSLYFNVDNDNLYKEYVGVVPTLCLDFKRSIFGIDESVLSVYKEEVKEVKYDKNIIDIDFDNLIENENDEMLVSMHNYFKEETGTYKNKYTEYFKDKNLILFMAESFNSIAVREDVTPTLYKLVNSGFIIKNYYSPVILSTIGGEYQELTGLYPSLDILSRVWRNGKNSYNWGIGNRFKDLGYSVYAYHDNQYNFQNRNNYLNALGFSNYTGCGNGLEKKINCKVWPQSDVEMIDATFDDYINKDKFLVYYATVSGHMDYNWGNYIANKNRNLVSGLNYSLESSAYLATQIELDKALESLINKLSKSGKLDDTVIALVGDHYPYALDISNINELSSYERDSTFLINKSNFILWNNKMKSVNVDKVGSQIDVIPTIYNLFGVKYDSRLFAGKDILSNTEGLAIFNNQSWVTDKGSYNSVTKKFISTGGDVSQEYIDNINSIVKNKVSMSKNLMKYNYYDYVTKKVEN